MFLPHAVTQLVLGLPNLFRIRYHHRHNMLLHCPSNVRVTNSLRCKILRFATPEYLVMLQIVKFEGIDAAPHEN